MLRMLMESCARLVESVESCAIRLDEAIKSREASRPFRKRSFMFVPFFCAKI
jgi:hypothetical protein